MNLVRALGAFGALGALLCVPACMLNGPSRTAQGQLYTSGNATYDGFFHDVHQQQVDAASWGDDKKGAHRSLVTTLELTPDAPDVTIVQATHEAASKGAKQPGALKLEVQRDGRARDGRHSDGGALFRAIEDTAHAELERAKRLHAVTPKLDALSKQAADLEGRVKADFDKNGIAKENEVATELMSSADVITKLRSRAEGEARESEDFVADLERALETASEASAAKQVARHKRRTDATVSSAPKPASPPRRVAAPRRAEARRAAAACAEAGGHGRGVHAVVPRCCARRARRAASRWVREGRTILVFARARPLSLLHT